MLVITINRPEARNAVNLAVSQGLADAMDELDDTPTCRSAIDHGRRRQLLCGHGSEGVRRRRGGRDSGPRHRLHRAAAAQAAHRGRRGLRAWPAAPRSCSPPTWWWRRETAKFGIPEVKRGLVAGGGGLLRLPRRIPYQKALELALTGESFTAEQGAAVGFRQRRSPSPARRWRVRSSWPSASRPTGRSRSRSPRRSSSKSADWSEDEMWKKQLRTHHAGLHVQRRHGGRHRVRREARAQLDRDLTATAPWISVSRTPPR